MRIIFFEVKKVMVSDILEMQIKVHICCSVYINVDAENGEISAFGRIKIK